MGLQACNFIKRLKHRCFLVNIPKVLWTALFIEQFRWLLFNYVCFSIRKNFEKRKLVERLPLILLTCFTYKYKSLQAGQLPQEHLCYAKFSEFHYTKYLKQEVDDNLHVCVHEHSPCGLAITGDIKIYQCLVIKR